MKNQPAKKISKNQPRQAEPVQKRSLPLSNFSKVMIVVIGVISLILIVLTMLDTNGLHLKWPEVIPVGSMMMPFILLVWGAVCLYNRIKSEKAQRVYRVVGILVVMSIGMFLLSFLLQYANMMLPHQYSVIKSPTGQKIAILHLMDLDMSGDDEVSESEQRMLERMAYINGEDFDPNAPIDEYPTAAYGYIYAAFPVKYGIFYTSDVETEGLIYRGMESKSTLRYEWLDDTTLNLYLENPEPGDSGTVKLSLNPAAAADGGVVSQ